MAMKSYSLAILLVIVYSVSSFRRVCYYTNWSQSRPLGGRFTPEDIDPYLCTHIIFAYARILGEKIVPTEWNDESSRNLVGQYEKVTELKYVNPDLKVMLGLNGWNTVSLLSDLPNAQTFRLNFVQSVIEFLRKRNFDGLDLNWAHPTARRMRPVRREIFTNLLQELRDGFDREARLTGNEPLLLTAAVSAERTIIDNRYDVPKLTDLLDFMNVMTFDFQGSWLSRLEHPSPLYSRSGQAGDEKYKNVAEAMNRWIAHGAARDKLLVGIPFYGRTFTVLSPSQTNMGDLDTGLGGAGIYTQERGFLSYYEICVLLRSGAIPKWDDEHRAPYIVNGTTWVAYDNPQSIEEKAKWLKDNEFGGAVVWAVDLDDFSGEFCDIGPYPLLQTLYDQLTRSHRRDFQSESYRAAGETSMNSLLSHPQSVFGPESEPTKQRQNFRSSFKTDEALVRKEPSELISSKSVSAKDPSNSFNEQRIRSPNDQLDKASLQINPHIQKTGTDSVHKSIQNSKDRKQNMVHPLVAGSKLNSDHSSLMQTEQSTNSDLVSDTNNGLVDMEPNVQDSLGIPTNVKSPLKPSKLNKDTRVLVNKYMAVNLDENAATSSAHRQIYDISPSIRGVKPNKMSLNERNIYVKTMKKNKNKSEDKNKNQLPVGLTFHKRKTPFSRGEVRLQEFASKSDTKRTPIKPERRINKADQTNRIIRQDKRKNDINSIMRQTNAISPSKSTNKPRPLRRKGAFSLDSAMNSNILESNFGRGTRWNGISVPYSVLCKYMNVLCFDHIKKVVIHGEDGKTLKGIWDKPDNITTTPYPSKEIIVKHSNNI